MIIDVDRFVLMEEQCVERDHLSEFFI